MLKPFSLFVFLCIAYIPTYGSKFDTTKLLQTDFLDYNGIHALSQNFLNVIKTPPEQFINLKIDKQSDYRYEASGVYKLIPYYQKIFPADSETSRFIIQKHPMNGEWLLTEIYASLFHKTIYSFTKEKQSENPILDAVVVKAFSIFQEQVEEMKIQNVNFKEEIDLKNKRINLLKQDYEAKIEKIKEEFEQKLQEKENQRIKLENPYEKLKFEIKQTFKEKQRLNEKKNVEEKQEIKKKSQTKIEDFEKNFQAKIEDLEEKLLEKENEINNFKTQLTKFQKLNENLKLEINGFSYNQNILEEKIKTCLSSYESVEKEFREAKIKLKEFEKKSIQVNKNIKKLDSIVKNKLSISQNFYEIKSEPFDIINTENKEKIEAEYEKQLIFLKNENHELLMKCQNLASHIPQFQKFQAESEGYQKMNKSLTSKVATLEKLNEFVKKQIKEEKEKSKIANEKLLEKEIQIQEKAIQIQEKENQIHYLQTKLEKLEIKKCSEFRLSDEYDCDENVEEEIFKLLEEKTEIEDLSNVGTDVSKLLISEKQECKQLLVNKEFEKEDLLVQLEKLNENLKLEQKRYQESVLIMCALEKENQMLHDWFKNVAIHRIEEKEKLTECQTLNENLKSKNEKYKKSILNMRNLNSNFVKQKIEEKEKLQICENELIEKENQIYDLKTQLVRFQDNEKLEKKIQEDILVTRHDYHGKKIEEEEVQSLREIISTEDTINLEEVDSKELGEITDFICEDFLKEYTHMKFQCEEIPVSETEILMNATNTNDTTEKYQIVKGRITKNFKTKIPKENDLKEFQTEAQVERIESKSTLTSDKIIQDPEDSIFQEAIYQHQIVKGITKNFKTKITKLEEENDLKEFQTEAQVERIESKSTSTSDDKIMQDPEDSIFQEGFYQLMKEYDVMMEEYDFMIKHMEIEYEQLVDSFFKKVDGLKDMEFSIKFSNFFSEQENVAWMDPIYQYELLFVHCGAICYAEEQENLIDKNFKFLDNIKNGKTTNIQNWWKETGKDIYIWILHKTKMKHESLLHDSLKSLEDEKTRVLITLFQKNPKLFDATQYKYESLSKEVGYLRYGSLYTLNYFKCMKGYLQ